jgi:hypothetical protein
MQEKTFTGASLEQALRSNALTRYGIELVGMVKPSQKEKHVGFTRAGCDAWIDLPIDMIEQAEHLGQHMCKEHSHPVIKIALKEAKDPQTQILSALLAQSMPTRSQEWPDSVPQRYSETPGRGAYGSPFLGPGADGGGATNQFFRTSARLGNGGFGLPTGGLNAWGCWTGSCCVAGHYEAGPLGWHWVCDRREPCERCIWPW